MAVDFKKLFTHSLLVTLVAYVTTFTSSLFASKYEFQPGVSIRGVYDDNVSTDFIDKQELSGYRLIPRFNFSIDNQRSVFRVSGDASFDRFNQSQFDTDDQTAAITYSRNYEKGSFTVNGRSEHTSTRSLENDTLNDGSREREASRADANTLSLSATYRPSEATTLQGSLSAQLREYDSDNVRDYQYFSASGLWQRVLNARTRMQTQLSYSLFAPKDFTSIDFTDELFQAAANQSVTGVDLAGRLQTCVNQINPGLIPTNQLAIGFPNNTNPIEVARCFDFKAFKTRQGTAALRLGFVRQLSEKWLLDVLAGISETGSKRDAFAVAQNGKFISRSKNHTSSYDISLSRKGERLTSTFSGSRNTVATSNGSLRLTTRLEVENDWKLSEKDSLSADITWFKREAESDLSTDEEQENFIISTSYNKRFTREWSSTIRYQYRQRSTDSQTSDAERSVISINLSWAPTPQRWSR